MSDLKELLKGNLRQFVADDFPNDLAQFDAEIDRTLEAAERAAALTKGPPADRATELPDPSTMVLVLQVSIFVFRMRKDLQDRDKERRQSEGREQPARADESKLRESISAWLERTSGLDEKTRAKIIDLILIVLKGWLG